MDWLFISTGLFLGWSLGANHAVNVFGTAVASRMVRFHTAAAIAGAFVIFGAAVSGAGTTRTLTALGAVNALAGCFTVALAVGIAVSWMTRLKLPVSTSQAVIGGILGWNVFTGAPTDTGSLAQIVVSWVSGPIIAAGVAFALHRVLVAALRRTPAHILHIDALTRTGLIVVGAGAAYLLGANNIANVMGMFVAASPFPDLSIGDVVHVSGTTLLFLVGGAAIAVGFRTHGERVIATVGKDLYALTPLAGLVVVLAEAIVLFLFTSATLATLLRSAGLPQIPLVPLSSTQVVVGGVIGVGFARGGRGINYTVLAKIGYGWLLAPAAAGALCFILLFVMQNVFTLEVVQVKTFRMDGGVRAEIKRNGVDTTSLASLEGMMFSGYGPLRRLLTSEHHRTETELRMIFDSAEIDSLRVDSILAHTGIDSSLMSSAQWRALQRLHGQVYAHRWQLDRALQAQDSSWQPRRSVQTDGGDAKALRERLYDLFRLRR